MATKVMTSEHARRTWGEVVDTVLAGDTVSVERHGRPVAVVINAKVWQQVLADMEELKRLRSLARREEMRAESRRVKAAIDRGEMGTIKHDDLVKLIAEKQTNVAAVGN